MMTFDWLGKFFKTKGLSSSHKAWQVGRKEPIYIDTNDCYSIYNDIPELQIVINKIVSMLLNGKAIIYRNGEIQDKHEALTLLANPNPLQTGHDFLAQMACNYLLYGNAFVHPLRTTMSMPRTVWNLPSKGMKVIPTGKLFEQRKEKDIIAGYELEVADGPNLKYKPKEVLHLKNSTNQDYITGVSVVESLVRPLSNIKLAYDTRNVIHGNKGAVGILSMENQKDEVGALPVGKSAEDISKQYTRQYGVGADQAKIIVSKKPVKWTPISYPTKDLMLYEEVEEDFRKICDSYGLSVDIFSTSKGSTFENKEKAMVGAYQDTVVPLANKITTALAKDWGLAEQGYTLELNFDHVNILQDDHASKINTRGVEINNIVTLLEKNLISEEDAKKMVNELYEL